MIYEWLERNRKDIDIITSFLVTVIDLRMHNNHHQCIYTVHHHDNSSRFLPTC